MADRDLIDKADALLKRHAISAPASGSDTGGIPILTDIVERPGGNAPEGPAADLARDIFTHVIAEVEGRLAEELERRIVEHLQAEVHVAVVSALGDLRQEVANAIGDAVTEALKRK
jgi:hypothetical protein